MKFSNHIKVAARICVPCTKQKLKACVICMSIMGRLLCSVRRCVLTGYWHKIAVTIPRFVCTYLDFPIVLSNNLWWIKNEHFRYMVSRRVRYRQRLLQNLVISGRMVIISTTEFSGRNSVVCPLCVRTGNVLLMHLTVNIVMPFVFVTGTQCFLCDVGSETSYIFQIICFIVYIIKQIVIA
jgi:hypothetical protein